MTNLRDGQITDLLNNSMAYNPETISIGYAILQEKKRIMDKADKTRLMSWVDSLDETILDYLAVELRTPAYRDSFPIGTKRELIKKTLPFYAMLGTPAAVNWIIQAIFGDGGIQEWYEYGGEPHHFQVTIPYSGAISPEIMDDLRRMIASVKRLTSWLDYIITVLKIDMGIYITPVLGRGMAITTLPVLEPEFPGSTLYIAPVLGSGSSITILPPLEPEFAPAIIVGRASAAFQSILETSLPWLEDPEQSAIPPADMMLSAIAHSITETALPPIPDPLILEPLRITHTVTPAQSAAILETTLPPLPEFATNVPATAYGRATADIQTITTTRLPQLEENRP